MDIRKLLDFNINAAHARTSILGFIEILRSKGDGYAKPGEESNDLGIRDEGTQGLPEPQSMTLNDLESDRSNSRESYSLPHSIPPPARETPPNIGQTIPSLVQGTAQIESAQYQRQPEQEPQAELLYASAPRDANQDATHQRSLDMCHPFFDPAMLDLFPDGEMPDLSQFDTDLLGLDYFDLGDWNVNPADDQVAH